MSEFVVVFDALDRAVMRCGDWWRPLLCEYRLAAELIDSWTVLYRAAERVWGVDGERVKRGIPSIYE